MLFLTRTKYNIDITQHLLFLAADAVLGLAAAVIGLGAFLLSLSFVLLSSFVSPPLLSSLPLVGAVDGLIVFNLFPLL